MGFIHSAECEIMHNSALMNIHMTHAAAELGVPRYFFSSSVCVYRDMQPGEPEMTEDEAIPAHPDNEYGWEKLYSERLAMAYGRRYGMQVRIARFQNCYGPEGTWCGGREKAPAAICRKIAEATDGGAIQVWADGTAVRSYTYIHDMVDGIYRLMQSDLQGPVNIGCPQYVTVDELVVTVAAVAGKHINIRHVDGPVGVQSRNFSNRKIYSIAWRPKFFLKDGIQRTCPWIEAQVNATSAPSAPLRETLGSWKDSSRRARRGFWPHALRLHRETTESNTPNRTHRADPSSNTRAETDRIQHPPRPLRALWASRFPLSPASFLQSPRSLLETSSSPFPLIQCSPSRPRRS
jgi:nucleoside-diphosphate-sugar epimerase